MMISVVPPQELHPPPLSSLFLPFLVSLFPVLLSLPGTKTHLNFVFDIIGTHFMNN